MINFFLFAFSLLFPDLIDFIFLMCFNVLQKLNKMIYSEKCHSFPNPSTLFFLPVSRLWVTKFIVLWFILPVFLFAKKKQIYLFPLLSDTKGKILLHLASLYLKICFGNPSILIEIGLILFYCCIIFHYVDAPYFTFSNHVRIFR